MPKFTLELPRLITTKKVERGHKDHFSVLLDSPPPTPKSVRPPLPADVEIALKAVCTDIFNKSNLAPLPGVDHDLLTKFWSKEADDERKNVDRRLEIYDGRPRMKHALTDPVRAYGQDQSARQTVLRVEKLMTETQLTQDPVRSQMHLRSQSSSGHLTASIPKGLQRRRHGAVPREDSIDTTFSTSQSEATDEPANASTAMTSAVVTPAHDSKRTSGHALASFVKSESEAGSSGRESTQPKNGKQWRSHDHQGDVKMIPSSVALLKDNHQQDLPDAVDTAPSLETVFHTPKPASRPTQGQRYYSQHNIIDPQTTAPTADADMQSARVHDAAVSRRNRSATMDSNASANDGRSGRSTFRSRAASSARSLSRGVKEYLRPGSRKAQNPGQEDERSEGWVQNAAVRIKDLTRPGTSTGTARRSVDFIRRARRASKESLGLQANNDRDLGTTEQSGTRHMWPDRQGSHQAATRHKRANKSVGGIALAKPAIDLNRELPPLPALGTWHDDTTMQSSAGERAGPAKAGAISDQTNKRNDSILPVAAEADDVSQPAITDKSELPPALPVEHETSPWPVMSATAFPGDFDCFIPIRTPSPISESSIKGMGLRARLSKRSIFSFAMSNFEDDEDLTLESPKVARLLNRLSAPDLRPQLVHNRRPSNPREPLPSTDAQDRAVSMDLSRPDAHPLPSRVSTMPPALGSDMPIEDQSAGSTIFKERPSARDSSTSISTNPVVLLRKKTRKQWWKAMPRKKDWMADVEQSGSRSGMLLMDETAVAPVIKYT